ncbi:hypothetical protein [Prochlorothrix hollandica]
MVAPVGGRQEGRHGGENPTRSRGFPSKLNPLNLLFQTIKLNYAPI